MRCHLLVTIAAGLLLAAGLFVGSSANDLPGKKIIAPPPPAFPKTAEDDPDEPDPPSTKKKTNSKAGTPDEEMLRRAELPTQGEELLKFFRKRILPESERATVERQIRQLGSAEYRVRARAALDLTTRGVAALEVLRASHALPNNLEMSRQIEHAIQQIREKDVAPEVLPAAIRVLILRKPAGFVEALLGTLPFVDYESAINEIRFALIDEAAKDAKTRTLLAAALADRAPLRRAVAAEALGRSALAQHKETLRKMLRDPDALVRLRVAQTLILAKERDAVPTLIDTLADLPINTAWQTEDFLLRLSPGKSPPAVPMANDKSGREKCRLAWQSWWKKNGDKIDLSKLEESPRLLGRTLVILLDQGKVLELGPDNLPRWEIRGLVFPLDAQLIDEDRVLVAEYHANRVTERNTHGEILWSVALTGPLAAQRLPSGNTFVVTDSDFYEFDKDGKEVWNVTVSNEGRKIMKGMKLPSGEIAAMLADSRIVRFDAKGQEVSSFTISLGTRLFGGRIHMLPTGRVLVPHNAEGKVVEYDSQGKAIWEVAFEQPIAAIRLSNGNTMITSMNPAVGAVEVDRAGVEVWSYRQSTRVTRAIRR